MFDRVALSLVLLSSCLFSGTLATLFLAPEQLPKNTAYDYIVIGGGTAGSVLANRLTENEKIRVLVIEAGSSDFTNFNIEVPNFAGRLSNSQFDWNFTTVNVSGLNGRSIPYTRGFVLGGSSSVNFMAYTRGSRDDFDRWANVTEDEQWSWNSLFPYMLKLDRPTPPTDGRDTSQDINASVHGTDGPLGFSVAANALATDDRVLNATSQLEGFPFNQDYNSGDMIGIGWLQSTIVGGARESAARAFLEPVINRNNLDILVNTRVTKLVKTGTEKDVPVFKGVEFAQSATGRTFSLQAKQEVILSAGAVQTPHLLMLSGIGDSKTLSSFGIDTLVDIPDVGQNLQDQPLVISSWTVNSTNTLDILQNNASVFEQQEAIWNATHGGLLANNAGSQVGWLRLPENSSIFETVTDPSAGPTSAHFEFIFTDFFISFFDAFPGGNFFSMFTVLVSPSSRGNITLASANPFDAPLINPNFYDTEFDIFVQREAIKAARTYVTAPSWDGWILEEFGAFAQAQTDDEIDEYARNTTDTINHVTCTASMGKTGSKGPGTGVLNSDLTVKGTSGLRVVDASAFPFIPAAHTQTAVYIMAERASDIIKAACVI